MKPHDGPHDGNNPHPGCFGCRIKTVNLGAEATASRTKDRVAPRTPDPAWERGVAGEHRPGGTFMPYLRPGTTTPMGVKEAGEKRRLIESSRSRAHNTQGG